MQDELADCEERGFAIRPRLHFVLLLRVSCNNTSDSTTARTKNNSFPSFTPHSAPCFTTHTILNYTALRLHTLRDQSNLSATYCTFLVTFITPRDFRGTFFFTVGYSTWQATNFITAFELKSRAAL